MLVVGLRCWRRNSSFSCPGEGTSPARSPPARESGTHGELREGPVKFIPYFSPLYPPPPPPATAGTLACRVGSGVYLTTPFAGASASSHRLSSVSLHCLPPWDRLGPSPCCVQASGLSGTRVPSPAASGSESKAPSGAGRGGGQTKQAQAREAGRDSVSAVMREKLFSHLSIMMITFTDCFWLHLERESRGRQHSSPFIRRSDCSPFLPVPQM